MPKLSPPKGLRPKSRKLWRSLTDLYDLRPDELETLETALRAADSAAELDDALQGQPLVVEGYRGALVAHPLIAERRQARDQSARLLKSLNLPDLPAADEGTGPRAAGDMPMTRSEAGQKAARARWDRAKGLS